MNDYRFANYLYEKGGRRDCRKGRSPRCSA